MPLRFPSLSKAKDKILKDCTVKHHKLCAIAFDRRGNVFSFDTNRQITKSTQESKWTIHAEEFLIDKLRRIKARERFSEIYVLVARWRRSIGWGIAKPCPDCQALLRAYGVDGVFYTDDEGEIQRLW